MKRMLGSLACVMAAGCGYVEEPPVGAPDLDLAFYECAVQPLMDRSCAFGGCHGDPARPLFLHSTSKTRSLGDALIGSPLTDYELCANHARSSAFAGAGDDSLLLTKPMKMSGPRAVEHEGLYFFDADSNEASCLRAWIAGERWAADGNGLPPEHCRMPWREGPDGSYPSCTPRSVDCAKALRDGDALPEAP